MVKGIQITTDNKDGGLLCWSMCKFSGYLLAAVIPMSYFYLLTVNKCLTFDANLCNISFIAFCYFAGSL